MYLWNFYSFYSLVFKNVCFLSECEENFSFLCLVFSLNCPKKYKYEQKKSLKPWNQSRIKKMKGLCSDLSTFRLLLAVVMWNNCYMKSV